MVSDWGPAVGQGAVASGERARMERLGNDWGAGEPMRWV